MNYCDKIHYNIYTTGLATFGEMVDALLAQLPGDEQILRLALRHAERQRAICLPSYHAAREDP